jgi:hypothetical protein
MDSGRTKELATSPLEENPTPKPVNVRALLMLSPLPAGKVIKPTPPDINASIRQRAAKEEGIAMGTQQRNMEPQLSMVANLCASFCGPARSVPPCAWCCATRHRCIHVRPLALYDWIQAVRYAYTAATVPDTHIHSRVGHRCTENP